MSIFTFEGQVCERPYGEADDVVFISTLDDPFAEEFSDRFGGSIVTVRYFVTDEKCTKQEAESDVLHQMHGVTDCEFGARYSEITGYLWTDEKAVIGGHDLVDHLRSNLGKWLIMEVKVHSEPQ